MAEVSRSFPNFRLPPLFMSHNIALPSTEVLSQSTLSQRRWCKYAPEHLGCLKAITANFDYEVSFQISTLPVWCKMINFQVKYSSQLCRSLKLILL